MTPHLRQLASTVALVVVAAVAVPAARAQGMDPDQERARQLVVRIRKSMREIDSLLLSGAKGDKAEKELAANAKRIEELLKETESKSQAVISGIDDLIKLTKYQQQQQQQQQSSGQGSDGDPQSGQGKQQPKREKSQDPQDLEKQPDQGKQPQDDPQQKPENGQKKDDPKKGDPKNGKPDSARPQQENADRPPPKGATGEFQRADTTGRWGMLPPKEAEELQRRDAEEFPQRYRRWMELYFQRVNKLPARDH